MRQTADWQLANPTRNPKNDWHYGALYEGIRALYEVTEDSRYIDELVNFGQLFDWKPMDDILHADPLAVVDNWGRGNGWIIAGLTKILTIMPDDYEGRKKFEQQYTEMAHELLSVQDEDGLWRVSLPDPEYIDLGESSGSAFFTYALAWGLNNGMLDPKYRPQVEKAWIALCNNVTPEGKLGYVQQVAGDPYSSNKEEWHVYATGAFLLCGKQMYLKAK